MGIQKIKENLKQIKNNKYSLSAQFPNKIHTNSAKSIAYIAGVHIRGATFIHPGGTQYGYKSKKAANQGKVRFLKTGTGYMVLGITGSHSITIPKRPFIQNAWILYQQEFWDLVVSDIAKNLTKSSFNIEDILAKAAFVFQQNVKSGLKQGKLNLAPLKHRTGQPLSDTAEMGNSLIIKVVKT